MTLDPKKLFSVSVKALVLDDEGKILVIKEDNGVWDLPGGRIEHSENILDALKRECNEEIGVDVEVVDHSPYIAASAQHKAGDWFLMLGYRVKPLSTEYKTTSEAVEWKHLGLDQLSSIALAQQTKTLLDQWPT